MADIRISDLLCALRADRAGCIAAAEAKYAAHIDGFIEDLLRDGRRRVILLAGPSSSGKTTTAAMLRAGLARRGHAAAVVSLDDFYRASDDPTYPRTPDGAPDYEAVEALHIDDIRTCLRTLSEGGEYLLPHFDFRTATRIPQAMPLRLAPGGYVIMEGLHALNPRLCEGVPDERLAKLFVSVSTNLTDDGGARLLSGRKIRFLRRLSRDAIYRNSDAANTYRLWQQVLRGEDLYLYPFRDRADAAIDTFHAYEIGLLRPHAEVLLAAPDAPHDAYTDAVSAAMRMFAPIADAAVPPDSLLREFI